MTTETKTAFATRLGIHKSNVTRAAAAGRIVLTAGGLVDVEASLKRWHETKGGRSDVEARHAENRGAEIPKPQQAAGNATAPPENATANATPAQPPSDNASAAGSGGENRTTWKAKRQHYENESIRLENDLRRGLRYQLDQVKRESQGLGATVRAAMERIIDQTAPRLAVMTNELDRRRLIAEELRRLKWLVKAEMPRALRRMRNVGGKAAE